MFHQLSIRATKIKNPLVWWSQHVMQFSHVFFFGSPNTWHCWLTKWYWKAMILWLKTTTSSWKTNNFLKRTLIYFEGLLVFIVLNLCCFVCYFAMFFWVCCLWVCNKAKGHMKVGNFSMYFFFLQNSNDEMGMFMKNLDGL